MKIRTKFIALNAVIVVIALATITTVCLYCLASITF